VVFLEDILKEEQDGVDQISKVLREHSTASASGDAAAAQAG
jgi:hypothetical protein